jgi:enamine deaminase RidA (YjgF/YER057c/UK114 family)
MNVYERLSAAQITLPELTAPVASFIPFFRTGNLIFVSGHIAMKNGNPWVGKLGVDISLEEGKAAARAVAIDLLGTLHAAIADLNKISHIVKLTVLVNSDPSFTNQHLVANGVSDFFKEILGDRGSHTRSSFGTSQIPFGSCVEVELIAEVE